MTAVLRQTNDRADRCATDRLHGKLLLGRGYVDDAAHVALTLQLADALIQENKDFDMFIHPALDHKNFWENGYMIRKSWDYFAEYLLHSTPPTGVTVPDNDGPAYRRPMHSDE